MIRKLALFLTFFFLLSFFAFGQWQWVTPKPSGYWNNKIVFTNSQKGFILNTNGDLISTKDQGVNWNIQANFSNVQMLDIKDSTGIMCGYFSTVFISRDNGISWQEKKPNLSDNFLFADVVSRDTIFMANNNGKIYRSDDGGNSWKMFNCGIPINSIGFINSKVGYAGGTNSHILKTVDGGQTWQQNLSVNHVPSNTIAIKFVDLNTGFAFREHSDLLSTKDGGLTWQKFDMGDNIFSFHFLNEMQGFACGGHGVMYRTDNGGATWNWIGNSGRIYAYDLSSIYFIDATIGFAVGARGRILKTTNGGMTWDTYSPTYSDISDISIPTNTTAYATVGNMVYKISDRGQSWNQIDLGITNSNLSLQKCYFFNADTGFVTITGFARPLKTYDGGRSWKIIQASAYAYERVNSLQFLNKNIGFLTVGSFGTALIAKTMDGGETWTQLWASKYSNEAFQNVHFLDEETAYASYYGTLFKTEDSTKTWKELWKAEMDDISAIWFTNQKNGYVVGDDALFKRTIDSGKTWSNVTLANQFYDDIYSVKFINELVGYVTTEYGAIFKTIDGGDTWKPNGNIKSSSLRTISFAPDSTVYLAGSYGTIVRSNIGELEVHSFKGQMQNNCSTEFSAIVTSLFSNADSIKFQYGINAFDKELQASPATVFDTKSLVTAFANNLLPSVSYSVRLKIFYNGSYHYSSSYTYMSPAKPLLPVITATATNFCQGETATLSTTTVSGNQWLLNSNSITGATNQSYTASISGKYQLVTSNGCYSSDTAFIQITVKPIPNKPTVGVSGNKLSSSSTYGNQWYLDGAAIVGGTNAEYIATKSGLYTLRVTEGNCISPSSDTIHFTTDNSKVTAYPNPVTNELTVRTNSGESFSIQLMNETGNVIQSAVSNTGLYVIPMSAFPSGIYFIRTTLIGTNETVVKMILKL